MGIAVAKSSGTDAEDSDKGGRTPSHSKGDTQENNGGQNAMLDEGLVNSAKSNGSTQHHRPDKGEGQKPKGTTADLNGPETHGHHDEKVVKTGERVKKTGGGCVGCRETVENRGVRPS